MLHRPSKAVMAPIAEAVGTLAGTLTQPFISRDVGYVQDDPGQKSRKVRNHMLKSPFKSVIARAATFALVLSLGIAFATVGLAPSASAQQADDPPCEATDRAGKFITCFYDENDDAPVADFTAMDPEGQGVEWDLNGDDASKFTIDGGVLEFKESPNYEPASASTYVVTVRATEILGEGDRGPANSSKIEVTVRINDLDEPGEVTFDYLLPEAGAEWQATLSDEDGTDSQDWEWSVPKVSRPSLTNDQHWTMAAGSGTSNIFTPMVATEDNPNTPGDEADPGDVGQFLRAKVTYSDEHGDQKVEYARTHVRVRETQDPDEDGDDDTDAITVPTTAVARNVKENVKPGTHVGNPVTATRDDDLNFLTYWFTVDTDGTPSSTPTDTRSRSVKFGTGTGVTDVFKINPETGQITVATKGLEFENANNSDESATNDGSYTVNVVARDPSGILSAIIPVEITVTDVNDAPKVTQVAYDGTVATEVLKVDINENFRLEPAKDDPDTTDVDENEDTLTMANVIGESNVITATDDDIPTIGVVTGKPPAANQVRLSLSGDDAAHFTLFEVDGEGADLDADPTNVTEPTSRYELRFDKSKPNFEAPMDANKDNRYKVTVVAEDQAGLTGMKHLIITVMNVAETGKVTLSTDQPAVGIPIIANLSDPDGGETNRKWQWQSSPTGGDGTFADIRGATSDTYTPKAEVEDDPATTLIDESDPGDEGVFLKAMVEYRDKESEDKDNPDTDDDESIRMREVVSDNAVRVEPDVNSDPVFGEAFTREVPENTKEDGFVGGPVEASDPDDDSLTYSITGGADMAAFKIDSATGQIMVGKGTKLDYEGSQTTYEVEVTATDPFDASDSTMVTIMVTDVNEPPSLTTDDPPCEATDRAGKFITCFYDENDDAPVADFTAMDPEGQEVEWDLNGDDASKFTIDGGVLEFKESPNYEPASASTYVVTLRATEILGEGDRGPANSSKIEVTVRINDLDEPGEVTFDYLLPEAGAEWQASFSDEDGTDSQDWEWSVPKVSRPSLTNDQHWTMAAGSGTSNIFTPMVATEDNPDTSGDEADPGDVGQFLRAKVTYSDEHGDEKVVYARTHVRVRETQDPDEDGDDDTDAITVPTTAVARNVKENVKPGTHVGNPVTATRDDDLNFLTYWFTVDTDGTPSSTPTDTRSRSVKFGTGTGVTDVFKINPETGQITVATKGLEFENANNSDESATNDGSYTVNVVARDPSGILSAIIPVEITVTDVNDAPKVTQVAYDGTVATEVLKVDINENFRLEPAKDDPDTTTVDENEDTLTMANVIGESNVITATDDDIPTIGVVTGKPPAANQVRLSLSGDDAAHFTLFEVDGEGADLDADPTNVTEPTSRYELRFDKSKPNFEAPMDANKDNRYKVTVVAEDQAGLTGMKHLIITVMNVAETGKVTLSTDQPAVGIPIIANLSDPDGGETNRKWQWQSSPTGGDGTFADIRGATSDTYTPKAEVEDDPATTLIDESDPGDEGVFLKAMVEYRDKESEDKDNPDTDDDESIRMREVVSDNAVRVEPDVNSDPVFGEAFTREVPENTKEDGFVGGPVEASDPDDDSLTYSITGGADMAAFKIDSATGQIMVGKGTKLDYEGSQTTYEVEVTATDPFDASDSTMVTIEVTDVNEEPALTLGGGSGPAPTTVEVTGDYAVDYEENGTGDVATYTSSVADVTWSLSGPDMDDFEISSGGVLSFSSPPDYEAPTDADTDNEYMVTVEATDGDTTDTLAVTVTVTNDTSDDATNGNGAFDPLSYDVDDSGAIERPEVITAIREYFADMIDRDEVIAVIRLYFAD